MRGSPVHLVLITAIVVSAAARATELPTDRSRSPREVNLTIAPSQISAGRTTLTLLQKTEDLTDEDGAVFYNKAVEALPADLQRGQVTYWAREPLRNLPLDQAEAKAVLQEAQASLDLVAQGARCKGCKWPPFVPGTLPANHSEYRLLNDLLCLKARIELLESQYDKAAETIRTGLAMSKHIGEAPTIMQGMIGVAMATLSLRSVEDWTQVQDAPNLYPALHELPRPLVNLNVGISSELKNLELNTQYNALVKAAMRRQLESSFPAVRRSMNGLDGAAAALECIEAIRHFAAGHAGQLPAQSARSRTSRSRTIPPPTSRLPIEWQK